MKRTAIIRIPIPTRTKVAVLKCYHHKCALCRRNPPPPELHHIDGNPSNNDTINILPLCPNCHSSIARVSPITILLFRKHGRREILSVEFEEVLKKCAFVVELSADDWIPWFIAPAEDLVAFVRQLDMGKYYAPRLKRLIWSEPEIETPTVEEYKVFHTLRCSAIENLIVDLLPHQGWQPQNEVWR